MLTGQLLWLLTQTFWA